MGGSILFYAPSAETVYEDDFTGTNGDAPNSSLWDEVDAPNNMSIQNNKLNYTGTEATTQTVHVTTKTEILVGDFDTQVDFDYSILNQPASGNQEAAMLELMTSGEVIYVAIAIYKNNGGVIQYNAIDSSAGNDLVTTTDTSGKFRITRTGSVIKGYTWSGSQWEWDGNTAGHTFSVTALDSLFVRLRFKQQANTTLNSNMDNFLATVMG